MSKHNSSLHGSDSSKSAHKEIAQNDLSLLALPTGEEILAEEMRLAAIDDVAFDYPEIPQYSDEELKRSLASNLENNFDTQENEEVQLMTLASEAFELWSNSKGKYTLLGAILKVSESTNWNSLFDNDNVAPKTSVNEQTALAVIEYLLGKNGEKWKLPYRSDEDLLEYRVEKTTTQSDPMEIVETLYPKIAAQPISESKKLDILTKVSILMMFTQVPKTDEFLERHIFLDRLMEGGDLTEIVNDTLQYCVGLEIKNHGFNYNYRLDKFIGLLRYVNSNFELDADGNGLGLTRLNVKGETYSKEENKEIAYWLLQRSKKVRESLLKMKAWGATKDMLYIAYAEFTCGFYKKLFNSERYRIKNFGIFDYLDTFKVRGKLTESKMKVYVLILKHFKEFSNEGVVIREHSSNLIRYLMSKGMTVKDLYDAGVPIHLLLDVFVEIKITDLIEAGISLKEIFDGGASLVRIHNAGISIETIEKELFGEYPDTVLFNLWKENTQLKSYMVMNEHVLDEHRNGAPDEKLWNKLYTEDVHERYKHTLTKKYILELEKLKKIKIKPQIHVYKRPHSEESFNNTIEVGGKVFYVLRPSTRRTDDVLAGPKGYEDERYVKGKELKREVKNMKMKLFKNRKEVEEFIDKRIPGATFSDRVGNFAHLLGLKKSGYRSHPTRSHQGVRKCAWLTEPEGGFALALGSSDSESGIRLRDINSFMPVVCFQEVKAKKETVDLRLTRIP